MHRQSDEKENRPHNANNKKDCMNIAVRICPADSFRRYFRMRGQVPMKAIAGNGGKKYKIKKIVVGELPYCKLVSLKYHRYRAARNKNIAINE